MQTAASRKNKAVTEKAAARQVHVGVTSTRTPQSRKRKSSLHTPSTSRKKAKELVTAALTQIQVKV